MDRLFQTLMLTFSFFSVLEAPKVLVYPQVTGYLGHNVTLPCTFQGNSSLTLGHWLLGSSEENGTSLGVLDPQHGLYIAQSVLTGRVKFTDNLMKGFSMTISDVRKSDEGRYTCLMTVYPDGSFKETSYLTVQVGPETMTILAPEIAEVSATTLLYCYVRSVPPAKLTWLFKGVETGVHEAAYVIDESSHSDSGDYTCIASNDVTGHTQSLTHTLTIEDRPSSPALSPGAAAGIAVAVTLVVVALVVVLYCGLTYHLNTTKGSLGADSRNGDQTYANVPGPTTRGIEAPPAPRRESE
ncbi:carcinoembryonic antigen-related cell adhesion molecule 20-like isoform X2 [Hypomesus transpacificus]|uniref:carcinoembryonic antigen-related cell adhesion molecule 20-like isoform X2 n=1 Tax=Hypomesus transpacificus TaxID=137520 RepID=UPI001F07AE6C|nr:carcinoembryonic antigen-related cell adhesion molecule 20-like isoform X2 [Hypomesus transpacificus]XP_046907243.1 carcinoembryonic antigen-related cell adhesion molecule 20-like isoform X2 [Hypomesus transpacificus]